MLNETFQCLFDNDIYMFLLTLVNPHFLQFNFWNSKIYTYELSRFALQEELIYFGPVFGV